MVASPRVTEERHSDVYIDPTATIAGDVSIGAGTRVWLQVQIREGSRIGRQCNLGKNVYVGVGVIVGDRCKIENNASLFDGVRLEDGVFVGPNVVFANDRLPRAINPDGTLKNAEDWEIGRSLAQRGASVGAGAVILPGRTLGAFAMIGAGTVVTADVPSFAVMVGNPGRVVGYTCVCGRRRTPRFDADDRGEQTCDRCRLA